MSDEWYFAWEGREFGPYTADQFKGLAAIGRLQPTDLVWVPGMTAPVAASRVKNLFAALPVHAVAVETPVEPADSASLAEAVPPPVTVEAPSEPVPVALPKPPAAPPPTVKPPFVPKKKTGRATAGPGAVIVSQDGERVQYKKKCTKCGYEEQTRHSLMIRNGVTRSPLFCPNCRKSQPVEVHCLVH